MWNTSKLSTKRRLNGARIDTVPLLEIAEVRCLVSGVPSGSKPFFFLVTERELA